MFSNDSWPNRVPCAVMAFFLLAGVSVVGAQEDFADGLGAGPDFWAVTGVADDDTLNVRRGPSTDFEVLGELANGTVVRNLGCRIESGSRWCRVRELVDQPAEGWASGRYLRESAGPEVTGGGRSITSDNPDAPDLYIRNTGEVEVNFAGGCGALFDANGDKITSGASCSEQQLATAGQAVADILAQ